ncbi:exodeoxyribonuclease VII large subunit [Pseudomonas putida]|nr:exodeoxyribonuclease VII large subunit [Pseudomonas putida]MDY4319294.1 exodeoxyribonuclease VII large subunit [Pseudomonas putida]MDY4352679.1 exodeoxyribonuclease VII large subunit [Pseudomonas putida]
MADIIDFKTGKRKGTPANETGLIKEESKDFTVLSLDSLYQEKIYSFKANEATRNILVTGETGSGKSTSIMLPAIQSFIKNDCPGLVLDIKADLYSAIHAIAKQHNKLDNIRFIGVHDFCEEINILASIKTVEQLKNILTSIKPYTSDQNSYWFYSGLMDVLDIVIIDKWFTEDILKEEYHFDFRTIHEYINNPNKTKRIVDNANHEIEFAKKEVVATIEKVIKEPFSLYPSDDAIHGIEAIEITQQKMWRSGQISTILTELVKEPFHSKLFNRDNPKSLHDYIYKDGKMLVLTVPLEHESTGYLVSKLLREVYFKAVCQNEIDDLDTYKIGIKHNRYTVLVIDEYQFYINTEQQNGVITDDNWLSISRGYGNINLFATQSISSMYSKSKNIYAVDTIVQNFANKFFLKSSDPTTCEHAKFLSGNGLFGDLIESVLLMPKNGKRTGFYKVTDDGGIECDVFNYGNDENCIYMNSDEFKTLKKQSANDLKSSVVKPDESKDQLTIVSTSEKSFTFSNKAAKRKTDFTESELYRAIRGSFKKHSKHLTKNYNLVTKFMNTPQNIVYSANAIDEAVATATKLEAFKSTLAIPYLQQINFFVKSMADIETTNSFVTEDENGNLTDVTVTLQTKLNERLKTAELFERDTNISLNSEIKPNIVVITHQGSNGYQDFVSTISTPVKLIFIQNYIKAIEDKAYRNSKEGTEIFKVISKADIVCFVRGGGDLTHTSFKYYRNAGLVPTVKKINPKCSVITAIGHSPDVFLADLYADESFITPTAAASELNMYIGHFYHYAKEITQDRAYMNSQKENEHNQEKHQPEIKRSFGSKLLSLFKRG